ncbi:MAG: polymer-forming cytoskeletal protein [Pyrinomonadaceae bacterium]
MLRMGKQQKEEPIASSTPAPLDSAANQARPPFNNEPYRTPVEAPAPAAQAPAANGSSSRAVTESESMARDIKDGNLSGFVGSGTSVTGEATFKMMLRIDGHISGRVSSEGGTLIVSSGGQVDANIEVAVALINGTVNGDIIATKRIEIGRVGKVLGNIKTPALIIESGAVFEGNCQMMQVKAALDKQQVSEVLTSPMNGSGANKKPELAEAAQAAS